MLLSLLWSSPRRNVLRRKRLQAMWLLSLSSTARSLSSTPSNVRTLVLVRHGAVDREAAGVPKDALYGGDIDVPLSLRGEAEARAAAAFVARTYDVQSVWSSPLSRAVFGAERIAEEAGIEEKVISREAFREIKRGDWVRKTPEDIEALSPGALRLSVEDPTFRPPGGESILDVQKRALKALQSDILPSIDPGRAAVLVSHLYVTRSLLAFALPDTPIATIKVPTASVSTLRFHEDKAFANPHVTLQGFKPDLNPQDEKNLPKGDAET